MIRTSCYICGIFMTAKQTTTTTSFVIKAYLGYFGMRLGDQDKTWAPHTVCRSCVENLRQSTKGIRKSFKFWDSDGMERASKSCKRLLLLYGEYFGFQC